jgi:cell volume regulation protein A
VALPERLTAVLEVESGLNDPMSVFLTLLLVEHLLIPNSVSAGHAALMFAQEMGGGAVLGALGGVILLGLLRWLVLDAVVFPVLVMTFVLALFGLAQTVGASGFLAVYLAGIIVCASRAPTRAAITRFFETFAWLAQIALFVLLGMLVTPHDMLPLAGGIATLAAVLMLVARPLGVFACLLPFGFTWRQTGFASWVGLRGAVPIYLTLVPVLAGARHGDLLFAATFGIVIASLVVQGWTIGLAARLFGFGAREL